MTIECKLAEQTIVAVDAQLEVLRMSIESANDTLCEIGKVGNSDLDTLRTLLSTQYVVDTARAQITMLQITRKFNVSQLELMDRGVHTHEDDLRDIEERLEYAGSGDVSTDVEIQCRESINSDLDDFMQGDVAAYIMDRYKVIYEVNTKALNECRVCIRLNDIENTVLESFDTSRTIEQILEIRERARSSLLQIRYDALDESIVMRAETICSRNNAVIAKLKGMLTN